MSKNRMRRGDMMLLIVLAMAAVLIGVRVGTASSFLENETTAFWGNLYIIIGLVICLLGLLAATILLRPQKGISPSIFPVALTAGLFGLSLVIGNGFDAVMWLGFDRLPAPTDKLLNLTDTILLAGSLLCGILAGIYLIRIALIWIAEERFCGGLFRWGALLPTLWIWLRIARYELAHAGLIDMDFSAYDFFLFVFAMLFLFRFAGLAANVGRKRLSSLRFLAAATAVCGLSDTLVRFGLYLTKDAQLYESIQLIGGVDFFMSLFALATMYFLWNGGLSESHSQPVETETSAATIPLILGEEAFDPPAQEEFPPEAADEEPFEPVIETAEEIPEEIAEPIAPPEVVDEPVMPTVEETDSPVEEIAVLAEEAVETEMSNDGEPILSVDDILKDILASRQANPRNE